MRVLWFVNTTSNFPIKGKTLYNGGGWISSLESAISKEPNISLGVCFNLDGQPGKIIYNKVCYYPLAYYHKNIFERIKDFCKKNTSSPVDNSPLLQEYLKVIDDFKPDIIHVFGTECDFGLISLYTTIPVVIHIQGILIPYLNAYFPPGVSKFSYLLHNLNLLSSFKKYRNYLNMKFASQREYSILKANKHFMGRTNWDKSIVGLYNSAATYDYCSEMLRDSFYNKSERVIPKKLIIVTTISSPIYKGMDVVFKCIDLLHEETIIDFEWIIFGNIDKEYYKKQLNKHSCLCHLKIMGVVGQEQIRDTILHSTLYVHPSFIDNSPNSVCEAQILGCPVIAQDVGGLSSLINNNIDGILLPANDPFQMAYAIIELYNDCERNIKMGKQAKEIALLRHNKIDIINTVISVYNKYISKDNE